MKDYNYWMEELKKCQADQWYFYINYTVDQNGNKPSISREEFYKKLDCRKVGPSNLRKRR
jgi:hypothetical protein